MSDKIQHEYSYSNIYWPRISEFNNLEIACCLNCGFGYSYPELTENFLLNFYRNLYRERSSPFTINFPRLQEPKLFSSRPLSQILLAKQFLAFEKNDKFLDLGPGNGHGLHVAKHFLHHPELYCVELNTGANEAYKRLYDAKGFSDIKHIPRFTQEKKFKFCLMSHVLEHYKSSELCPLLKTLKSMLDDDGILLAEVPNVDLRIHSSFRFEDSPHLLFFSQESLGLLFEKNNWEVLFLNTVAEKYEDWWEHKKKLVNGNSFTPKTKEIFSKDRRITDCIDHQFAYGGDRTCLRIVAKPIRAK